MDKNIYKMEIQIYNSNMFIEFSNSEKITEAIAYSLKSVWIIEADSTYDVKKGGAQKKELVALRTTRGVGKVSIEGVEDIETVEGTLLIFEHDKVKRYYCAEKQWDFCWFEFYDYGNTDLVLNQLISIKTSDNEMDKIYTCLNMLRQEGNSAKQIASSLFTALFYEWLRNMDNYGHNKDQYNEEIIKTINYMKANLNKNISMEMLAAQVGFCERRYRQLFKSIYGLTPRAYLKQLKMETAAALLRNTPISVYELSERLGYSSQFHFSREFKKYYNRTPSEHRKKR